MNNGHPQMIPFSTDLRHAGMKISLMLIALAVGGFHLLAAPAYQGQLNAGLTGYGTAVATDGSQLCVSAQQSVDFYKWDGLTWRLQSRLATPNNVLSLAIYKTSALGKHASGVYAFEWTGTAWALTQSLALADGFGVYSGKGVSLRSNTAAVGAPNAVSGRGQVYVLGRAAAGSPWALTQIVASPTTTADNFGVVVSLGATSNAQYMLTSATMALGGKGIVYAHRQSGFTFTPAGSIASPSSGVARFGESIGGESSYVLIGAPANLGFAGSAHLYQLSFSGGALSATPLQTITSNAPLMFGAGCVLTSSYALISSRSTLTWYEFTGGAIGMATALPVPSPSSIWGTALAAAGKFVFAGDRGTNGGAGGVAWYR